MRESENNCSLLEASFLKMDESVILRTLNDAVFNDYNLRKSLPIVNTSEPIVMNEAAILGTLNDAVFNDYNSRNPSPVVNTSKTIDMNESWILQTLNDTVFNDYNSRNISSTVNTSLTINGTQAVITDSNVFRTYPPGLLEFATACCVVFIILGVPGNLLTVAALLKTPKLRNATTAFIVNLCLADAFFCVSSLPLAASTFLRRRWIHGDTLCKLAPLFRYSNVAVSLFTVLAITINRYVLICHPTKYNLLYTKWKMVFFIGCLWIAAIGLLIPSLLGVWGDLGFDEKVGTCTIIKVNGKSPKTFIYLISFILPTVVFVACYSRVIYVVRKSSRNIQVPATISGPRRADSRVFKIHSQTRKDLRLLKIVAVIYGTFVVCFLPVALAKIFMIEDEFPVINVLGYLGVFVSACLNPLIYVVMSKEYRRAYTNLFTRFRNNNPNSGSS